MIRGIWWLPKVPLVPKGTVDSNTDAKEVIVCLSSKQVYKNITILIGTVEAPIHRASVPQLDPHSILLLRFPWKNTEDGKLDYLLVWQEDENRKFLLKRGNGPRENSLLVSLYRIGAGKYKDAASNESPMTLFSAVVDKMVEGTINEFLGIIHSL